MDSDGSDEAHHSDPAQDLQHIERQDCPSSWALWSLAHQHFCLSISISIMLMLLCVFSKEDDYSKSPQTPSFVSKCFFIGRNNKSPRKFGPGWGPSNGSTSSSRLFHRGSDLTWGIGGLLLAKQARLAWPKLMFFWGVWWGKLRSQWNGMDGRSYVRIDEEFEDVELFKYLSNGFKLIFLDRTVDWYVDFSCTNGYGKTFEDVTCTRSYGCSLFATVSHNSFKSWWKIVKVQGKQSCQHQCHRCQVSWCQCDTALGAIGHQVSWCNSFFDYLIHLSSSWFILILPKVQCSTYRWCGIAIQNFVSKLSFRIQSERVADRTGRYPRRGTGSGWCWEIYLGYLGVFKDCCLYRYTWGRRKLLQPFINLHEFILMLVLWSGQNPFNADLPPLPPGETRGFGQGSHAQSNRVAGSGSNPWC